MFTTNLPGKFSGKKKVSVNYSKFENPFFSKFWPFFKMLNIFSKLCHFLNHHFIPKFWPFFQNFKSWLKLRKIIQKTIVHFYFIIIFSNFAGKFSVEIFRCIKKWKRKKDIFFGTVQLLGNFPKVFQIFYRKVSQN